VRNKSVGTFRRLIEIEKITDFSTLLCGCIISHSAATAAVVNSLEAHIFEKLLRNFSKICASKEFYSPPQAAI
jgi:hypothetical protein